MTDVSEQQAVVAPKLPTRAELAESGLTKRNQEFMHKVTQLVTDVEKQGTLVDEIQAKLLTGQKSGKTAQQLYGTPAEALGLVVKHDAKQSKANPVVESRREQSAAYARHPWWMLAVDNSIAFFMLFNFMFGVMLMFGGRSYQQQAGSAGLVSLILTAVLGGMFYAGATKLMINPKGSKWVKILSAVVLFVLWFAIYMLLSFLPRVINPIMPGWIYIILAIIAFFSFRYWRGRTKMAGGFLGSMGQQARNAK